VLARENLLSVPSLNLTQLSVDKLSAPKKGRVIYWDRLLPGFGLRVTSAGAKTWVAMYRVDRRSVMETIAPLARMPKLSDARAQARASMATAAAGTNPVAKRRETEKAEAQNTVAAAVSAYLDRCDRELALKTAYEWRRIFEHDVLPRWGGRQLYDIGKGDVLELINEKAARRERARSGAGDGAVVQANRTLTRLRTFFAWATANDLVGSDPTAGVWKPVREVARDRVLSVDEIRSFWAGCDQLRMPFGSLFPLMLLTAQRESECAGVRWSEIDTAAQTWTIPSSRSKNRKPHIVHLTALSLAIIGSVPRKNAQDLLFSGSGETAVSGFSRAKQRLDRLMGTSATPWVLHDLRRTATTGMAALGIAPHVADRVLNHSAGTIRGVAAVYNRFDYLGERKAALETWSLYIEDILGIAAQNVVQFAPIR
jgi:integrase